MPKSARKHRLYVNLLYPQGLSEKAYFVFVKWLLNYGRYIIIAVELVVIAAFIARFKLDSDLATLKEDINKQVPFIESLHAEEQLIRRTQFKIATIKKDLDLAPEWKTILGKISAQIPIGARLQTINVQRDNETSAVNFTLNGQALSNNDLAIILGGLKKETYFKNVSLTNISFDQGAIVFTIVGTTSNSTASRPNSPDIQPKEDIIDKIIQS